MTTLLSAIWQGRAADPEACEMVRAIMRWQYAPHRLASGFPDRVVVSSKTGTLLGGIRNEIGVVEYGENHHYVVAIFVRQPGYELRHPAADLAVGTIGRIAVDALHAAVVAVA